MSKSRKKNIVGILDLGEGAECRGAYGIRMRLGHLTVKPGYDRISFMFFFKTILGAEPEPPTDSKQNHVTMLHSVDLGSLP